MCKVYCRIVGKWLRRMMEETNRKKYGRQQEIN